MVVRSRDHDRASTLPPIALQQTLTLSTTRRSSRYCWQKEACQSCLGSGSPTTHELDDDSFYRIAFQNGGNSCRRTRTYSRSAATSRTPFLASWLKSRSKLSVTTKFLACLLLLLCVFSGSTNAQVRTPTRPHDRRALLAGRQASMPSYIESNDANDIIRRTSAKRQERRASKDGGSTCTGDSCTTATPTADGKDTPPTSTTEPTKSSLLAAPTSTPTDLPTAFDTSLGNNFTNSGCEDFFYSFLQDPSFVQCHPLSLLLKTSKSFFDASKSLVRLTETLDASCGADLNQCNGVMQQLNSRLRSECSADLALNNPIVTQALHGFEAYTTMYQVGCLKDSKGSYCYADAVTNWESPTDSFVYYLPSGLPLPAGTRPTCDSCLQRTMAIFATAATDAGQPITQVYSIAAQQVNIACGPNFADTAVVAAADTEDAATAMATPGLWPLSLALALVASWIIA